MVNQFSDSFIQTKIKNDTYEKDIFINYVYNSFFQYVRTE